MCVCSPLQHPDLPFWVFLDFFLTTEVPWCFECFEQFRSVFLGSLRGYGVLKIIGVLGGFPWAFAYTPRIGRLEQRIANAAENGLQTFNTKI